MEEVRQRVNEIKWKRRMEERKDGEKDGEQVKEKRDLSHCLYTHCHRCHSIVDPSEQQKLSISPNETTAGNAVCLFDLSSIISARNYRLLT